MRFRRWYNVVFVIAHIIALAKRLTKINIFVLIRSWARASWPILRVNAGTLPRRMNHWFTELILNWQKYWFDWIPNQTKKPATFKCCIFRVICDNWFREHRQRSEHTVLIWLPTSMHLITFNCRGLKFFTQIPIKNLHLILNIQYTIVHFARIALRLRFLFN